MAALRHRYLQDMGIDVWVSRKAHEADSPAHQVQTDPDPVSPEAPAHSPSFRLCFMTAGDCGLIFEAPSDEDASACHRLGEDILLALTGKGLRPEASLLEWPLVAAGHIEQDAGAATEAVQRRVESMPRRLVVFGELACRYVAGGEAAEPVRIGSRRVLGAPPLTRLIAEPLGKRELWRRLSDFRGEP